MCRLCGRTIKCIFDSMPSRVRIHNVPSRRAFTTVQRSTTTTSPASGLRTSTSPSSSLLKSFSTLSLAVTRPTVNSSPSQLFTSPQTLRPFSTSTALQGSRRRMDTFSPSRRVQKRRHGYLARMKTKAGQEVIKRRRLAGRRFLTW